MGFVEVNAACCMSWCAQAVCAAFIRPVSSIEKTNGNTLIKDVERCEQEFKRVPEKKQNGRKEKTEAHALPHGAKRDAALHEKLR